MEKAKKTIIGLRDFRENTKTIIEDINNGKSFIVMKKNQPVFKISPVDNEDVWEELVDFTKIKKGGVEINDLLKRL